MKRKGEIVTIVIFISLLIMFSGLIRVRNQKIFSESENRYLSQKPGYILKDMINGTFEEQYQKYLNDQFICRDSMMSVYTNSKKMLMNQDVNGVFLGKKGYLIEKHDWHIYESDQQQKNYSELKEFVDCYQDSVKSMKVMMIPSAETILTDKLPSFAPTYNEKDAIKRLSQAVGENNSIEVAPVLKEHSNEYIYYKTDHHYTTLGAFYCYKKWMNDAGLEANDLSDFERQAISDQFYGTLESKLNDKTDADTIYTYEPVNSFDFSIRYNNTDEVKKTLYDVDALKTKDKYRVFLGGNNPLLEIDTANGNGRSLLIIKDSFANCLIPFLINQFEKIDIVDLRYYNSSIEERLKTNQYTDILILYNIANFCTDKNIFKLNN